MVLHVDQTPPAHRFDHLGVEDFGQGHPVRFGGWPCSLAARHLDPMAKMGHDGGEVLLIAITEKQGDAVRSQQEGHLVEDALRHGQSPLTDVERQEQFKQDLENLRRNHYAPIRHEITVSYV